jgi:recombinational DNA repair protein RecR
MIYEMIDDVCQVCDRTDAKREKKVVVLVELHRAIIYTTKMSKQVTKSHVRDAVLMYSVN